MTDDSGNVVWCNYEYAWGGRYTHHYTTQNLNGYDILEHELQPIRFQGQFFDTETSLHYNRFRYYDSDVGMFISRDPIGLLGGNNVFQYAPNPIGWVDPWGLAKVTAKMQPYRYEDVIVKNPHADILVDGKKVTEAKLNINSEGKISWERFGDMKSASRKEISQAQKLIDDLHNNEGIMNEAKKQLSQGIKDAESRIKDMSPKKPEYGRASRGKEKFEKMLSGCSKA